MQAGRRTNFFLGLVPAIVALLLLLRAFDVFSNGIDDIMIRSWPLLLVILGLVLLLRERITAGSFIALVISGALIAGIVTAAYSMHRNDARTDQRVAINESVDAQTALLVINVETLDTDVEIRTLETDTETVEGEFVGSLASEVSFNCVQGEVAECTFTELKPDGFPPLDAVGRGSLSLRIPDELPVAVAFAGTEGNATFDLNDAQLERIAVELQSGDVLLTVPAYQPQSPSAINDPGRLILANGDLTVVVPANVNARLGFDRRGSGIDPQYPTDYIEQRNTVDGLLRRDVENGSITLEYDILIPRGQLRLDVSPS
jgi:hypothetical protein